MRRLLFVSLACLSVQCTLAADALRLVCDVDGRSLPLVAVEKEQLLLHDGEKNVPAPKDAHWRIEGDWKQGVHLFRWSPAYGVHRKQSPDSEPPELPCAANVFITHAAVDHRGEPSASTLLRDWPEGTTANTVAVFVWLVQERSAFVSARLVPGTDESKRFSVGASFDMSAEDAAQGQAGAALWREGAFVPPAPIFAAAAGQDALAAVIFNDAPALRAAIAAGAKPAAPGLGGASLIHIAAEAGAADALQALLEIDRKLAAAKRDGSRTPLHWAASKGREQTVRWLIAAGAPKDAKDKNGATPLLAACEDGHAAVAQALIEARATLNVEDSKHQTALGAAIDRGDADLAERLHRAGATFPRGDQVGRVLLTQVRLGHTGIVRWLIGQGVDARTEIRGENALFAAAAQGDPALAALLIEKKVQVDRANRSGRTPLMAAAMHGRAGFARQLLDAGASISAKTSQGLTALHYAALWNRAEVASLLLDRGADLAAAPANEISPLDVALMAESAEAMHVLIARGAAINLQSKQARASLEFAIRLDAADLIERALKDGWSPNNALSGGWPALRLAELFRSSRVAAVLRQAGATTDDLIPARFARPGEYDTAPRISRMVVPDDPRDPFDDFPAQTLNVEVLIDATGQAHFPRVRESPDVRLRAAVQAVVREWQFIPAASGGQPVATRVAVPVVFPASINRAFESGQVDEPPQILKPVAPIYPASEKHNGTQARVTVGFIVNREGNLESLRVIETTGEAFSKAALAALQQWKFKPAQLDGRPVPVKMAQPIIFSIDR